MMGSKGNLLRTIGAASGAKSATGMRRSLQDSGWKQRITFSLHGHSVSMILMSPFFVARVGRVLPVLGRRQ
jgi:hypothetical protein